MQSIQQSNQSTPTYRIHRMPFGAEVMDRGVTRFRLWAPSHARIRVQIDDDPKLLELAAVESGWHELTTSRATHGTRYRFILSDGTAIVDPASRYQPTAVDSPSEVIDPRAYRWHDSRWRGQPWETAVIYELHVGTFTGPGTFRAAAHKLDHLQRLGVTAVELMPIGSFSGERNWGYDGVLWFAPDSSYGRPEDLKAFVDEAHARGIMVLLDVVYNHFGPRGNPLPQCSRNVFTERHQTPWGAAVNFDGPESRVMRDLVIHNALYWLQEFHVDGLRLDAVHAILDDSPEHLLLELARRVRSDIAGRRVHLVIENEANEAQLLERSPPRYDAQWNDDVHHVLHVAATDEDAGYYGDYRGDAYKLGRALAEGFAFQGELMEFRCKERGQPSGHLPPAAFVAFLQNHDQIGNRAFGERLTHLATRDVTRAVSAVYLLLPQIPLLFMGEEWAARQPFLFFCDFDGELGDSVRDGRRQEFAKFPEFASPDARERIPDPLAASTFAAAKLNWEDLRLEPHAECLERYRALLAVRRERIVPLVGSIPSGGTYRVVDSAGAIVVEWRCADATLVLTANLRHVTTQFPMPSGEELWREGAIASDGTFGPWAVRWAIRSHE